MKRGAGFVSVITLAAVAAMTGYWLGHRDHGGGNAPVAKAAVVPGGPGTKTERKVLYYRHPMGLPDTSPVPKKDAMGMDYVPVYAGGADGEAENSNQLKISTEKVQKLGVRTETARRRHLHRMVRAVGRVEPDERRIYTITPKFEGYVERLFVNVTGQPVASGQPLFEVYSPELVSAQREYAIAAQGVEALKGAQDHARTGMKELADASLLRLRNWDISEEQIRALVTSADAKRTLTFRSPVTGIVTEKKALQGMRFMPGQALYQVADLSRVWVLADVFEQEIGLVKTGAQAMIRISAYPERQFTGRITYVYPTLNADTRTIPVRVELANPAQLLKPAMYADVEIPADGKDRVLAVPASAVIDSGIRRIVLVQLKEGRFEPREVKLGNRSDDYVEVIAGVKEGEEIVVAANFLIDAESNLKAAAGGFGTGGHATGSGSPASTPAKSVVGHRAEGTLDAVDADLSKVRISHNAIPTLKWPAMTMDFDLANRALAKDLQAGTPLSFELVERKPGEYIVTRIQAKGSASSVTQHSGH